MRKGKRVIPPEARSEINHKIMQKVRNQRYRLSIYLTWRRSKSLSAEINNSIERQMVAAASTGKLTVMKNVATDMRPES
jgi:hypothetical protein